MEDVYEAMIAAFDHDGDRAIAALAKAVRHRLRASWVVGDPVFFCEMRDEPRFATLRRELNEILAEEQNRILQLICFNNPVPEEWRPLPGTCKGVVEDRAL